MEFGAELTALTVLAHLTGLWAAVIAIRRVRTPQGAIAWSIFLITLPYLAVPLFLMFGGSRLHGYEIALRKAGRLHEDQIQEVFTRTSAYRVGLPSELAHTENLFTALTRWPITRGNSINLCVDGEATFGAIFRAIEAARRRVLLQFFIVRDDGLGQRLKDLLIRRRGEGIEIYFLADRIGSINLPRRYFDELRAAGVHCRFFQITRPILHGLRVHFRNHRKAVVVDGEIAFVGGHNIGDEYLGVTDDFEGWRDTTVAVRGPAVRPIELLFAEDWFCCSNEHLQLPRVPLQEYPDNLAILPFASGPSRHPEAGTLYFLEAIRTAQRRLWISTPYFVPGQSVKISLLQAAFRGVDVRILLPRNADHVIVWLAGLSVVREFLHSGVKLLWYPRGFLHQKAFVVDDSWGSVGTSNLDNRSFRLNFELNIAVFGSAGVAQIATMLENDFSRSESISEEDPLFHSSIRSFAADFCQLFAPVL